MTDSPVPEAVKEEAPEKVLASVPVWVYAPLVVIPVTLDRAPELITRLLMVLDEVGAVMAPTT